MGAFAGAQTSEKPASKKVSAHRANELTLRRLRPGRDTATRGIPLYRLPHFVVRTVENRARAGRRDNAARVVALYGQPDSRSPSTKDGQPLELMYYAFDWAGPDVPQVMEVLCTKAAEGKPGRVMEITLAAPSL